MNVKRALTCVIQHHIVLIILEDSLAALALLDMKDQCSINASVWNKNERKRIEEEENEERRRKNIKEEKGNKRKNKNN